MFCLNVQLFVYFCQLFVYTIHLLTLSDLSPCNFVSYLFTIISCSNQLFVYYPSIKVALFFRRKQNQRSDILHKEFITGFISEFKRLMLHVVLLKLWWCWTAGKSNFITNLLWFVKSGRFAVHCQELWLLEEEGFNFTYCEFMMLLVEKRPELSGSFNDDWQQKYSIFAFWTG